MIIRLIFRNTARNFRKSRPVLIIFAAAVALTLLGNSLLEAASSGYEAFFRQGIAGDHSVGPQAAAEFTLFGSDALLVGEFHVPPVFAEYASARQELALKQPEAELAGVVSATARVEFGRSEEKVFLFGVDLEEFSSFAQQIQFIEGAWPEDEEQNYLVLTRQRHEQIQSEAREAVPLGSRLLLSSAANDSFSIREATLVGIIELPLEDQVLERLAFTSAGLARTMNGYLSGTEEGLQDTGAALDILGGDLDSLLGADSSQQGGEAQIPASQAEAQAEEGSMFDLLGNLYWEPETAGTLGVGEKNQPEKKFDAAWNFLLVRSPQAPNMPGLLVRDWRASVGGQVVLLGLIQGFFNVGLIFVVLGSMLILSNSLALSVLERTHEIGTMRALGAGRGFVAAVVGGETLFLVAMATIFGLIVGALAAGLINMASIPLDNAFLRSLFAASSIQSQLSLGSLLLHLGGGLLLGATALVLPVSQAVRIHPVKAMSE